MERAECYPDRSRSFLWRASRHVFPSLSGFRDSYGKAIIDSLQNEAGLSQRGFQTWRPAPDADSGRRQFLRQAHGSLLEQLLFAAKLRVEDTLAATRFPPPLF